MKCNYVVLQETEALEVVRDFLVGKESQLLVVEEAFQDYRDLRVIQVSLVHRDYPD